MAKTKSTFFKDFKAFIAKGSIIDMAVGVVIGQAFGKIVTSLVNDIIMPPISLLTGGIEFSKLNVLLKPEVLDDAGEVAVKAITLNYGNFIQIILDFLIIAFCIFLILRAITKAHAAAEKLKKKEEEAKAAEPAPAPVPSEEVLLLREIRDSLKK